MTKNLAIDHQLPQNQLKTTCSEFSWNLSNRPPEQDKISNYIKKKIKYRQWIIQKSHRLFLEVCNEIQMGGNFWRSSLVFRREKGVEEKLSQLLNNWTFHSICRVTRLVGSLSTKIMAPFGDFLGINKINFLLHIAIRKGRLFLF